MANKMKLHGLNTMHTAGIFSDMTVDGPEIGTLVIIVDRAKNLPNRKTIGKQHPYCAARLGKEAKKTETDRRGGQTPKWDQELRYTVHDSPDYYQLKVSVFNDDRKTDLIGETWVDLKEVIIPGGGQNDLWHTLNYKGKYAGELRVEITYYDTRPQQEKSEKNDLNPSNIVESEVVSDEAQRGSRRKQQQKPGIKRRPLPTDPVTGEPGPLGHLGLDEGTGLRSASFQLKNKSDQSYSIAPGLVPISQQSQKNYAFDSPDHIVSFPRSYLHASNSLPNIKPEHSHISHKHQTNPLTSTLEHGHIATRGGKHSTGYMTNHEAQIVKEYKGSAYIPPNCHNSTHDANKLNRYGELSDASMVSSASQTRQRWKYQYDNPGQQTHRTGHRADSQEPVEQRDQFTPRNLPLDVPYEIPSSEEFGAPVSPGRPPPPPPIHRSQNSNHRISLGSGHVSAPGPGQVRVSQGSYIFPSDGYNLGCNSSTVDESRYSSPHYNRSNLYQAYSPEIYKKLNYSPVENFQGSPAQHLTNRSKYDDDVEIIGTPFEGTNFVPFSGGDYFDGRNSGELFEQKKHSYLQTSSPIRSNDEKLDYFGHDNLPVTPDHQYSQTSNRPSYPYEMSQVSHTDRSAHRSSSLDQSEINLIGHKDKQMGTYSDYRGRDSVSYGLSQVPMNLVPGMTSPAENASSNQICGENQDITGNLIQKISESSLRKTNTYTIPYRETALPYDERHKRYSASILPDSKLNSTRPDARRSTTRKSVSPSPSRPGNQRRNSAVPFGPESYNTFNPSISTSTSNISLSAAYKTKVEPEAKIITHDGREIDPSDHIPESNYAPLLEKKSNKNSSQLPDRDLGPMQVTHQTSVAIGPRLPRNASRPQLAITMGNSPTNTNGSSSSSAEYNRLQNISSHSFTDVMPHSSHLIYNTAHQGTFHGAQTNFKCGYIPKGVSETYNMNYQQRDDYNPSQYDNSPVRRNYRASTLPPIPVKVSGTLSESKPWSLINERRRHY